VNEIRVATRNSRLALAQAALVAERLRAAHPRLGVRLIPVVTTGDADQRSSITELTELGAFVRAVQEVVLAGEADLAVHSLKDLPVAEWDELVLAAIPERASPFDVLVGRGLDELAAGALVGTGSPRRREQLLELRPDLQTTELRGNIDTRLRKVADEKVDAAILAEAGLVRLAEIRQIAYRFESWEMVPAPGQGALAVEARRGSEAASLAEAIDDHLVRRTVTAERMLLAETGAGCRAALGALATWQGGQLHLDAFVADDRGRRRASGIGETAEAVVADVRKALGL